MAAEDLSRTNPFWEQFKEFRARLRDNVVNQSVHDEPDRTDKLLREADVAIRQAIADEFDAYAWGDGEEYHLEEYEAMVLIGERIKRNIEMRKMRRIRDEVDKSGSVVYPSAIGGGNN